MDEIQRERYSRHILLREVGGQGQKTLLAARVLIVGAGGLGAPVLQYLAAAGVGHIGLVDDDRVALSNLQRQVIFRDADVGRPKTEAAAAFVNALNPDIDFCPHTVRIDAKNAAELIAGHDLVVEGVDNFETRFTVNAGAIAAKTTLVSAAVGRFDGQVATFKPHEGPGRLPCYQCLVPEAPPREAVVNCAEEGVLGAVTGVVGALAAMEALKELLGVGESLAGRLMIYDGLGARCRTVALPADPACPACAQLKDPP